MNILTTMPVSFINSAVPPISSIVIFCATTLGTLTIIVTLLYIFLRPIKELEPLAPLKQFKHRIQDFTCVAASAGGAYLLAKIIKGIFKIPRPFITDPSIHTLISETGYGSPSGHATTYMALAVALYFMNRKAGIIGLIVSLLIGFGRIFTGVHSPLDVISGYIFGALFAYLISHFYKKVRANSNKAIISKEGSDLAK